MNAQDRRSKDRVTPGIAASDRMIPVAPPLDETPPEACQASGVLAVVVLLLIAFSGLVPLGL